MERTPSVQAPSIPTGAARPQDVYLQRLQRLLTLRRRHEGELNPRGLRLLDRAIFAAYCACRDGGAETQARAVLRDANVTLDRPGPPSADAA